MPPPLARTPFVLTLGLMLAACTASGPATRPMPSPAKAIDPDDLMRRLTQGLMAREKAGQSTPQATLQNQLNRSRSPLALPVGPTTHELSLPDLYALARQSVMVIGGIYKCTHCPNTHMVTATGFMLTSDGVMVTNYHVIAAEKGPNAPRITSLGAMDADGHIFGIQEVLAADEAADIAVVRLDAKQGTIFHPLPLGRAAAVGESVAILGHPSHNFFVLSTGIVSQYVQKAEHGKPVPWMCVTAEYGVGSSGSPVMNSAGEVVGMVSSTTPVIPPTHDEHTPPCTQMLFRYCVPERSIHGLVGKEARE